MSSEKKSETSKSGVRRKPHDEVRAAALAAAEMIVVEEGLAAMTARRVAAAAECSVGTLYNIFGHLDGLIGEVNLITLRRLVEDAARSQRELPEGVGRETRLVALATAYLHFARTHRNRWAAVFEHRPGTPGDGRREAMEQLAFARIISTAGIDPKGASKDEQDSLLMLMAAIHGVVAFTMNQTIPVRDAERYVELIVKAGVRGYRELVEEGLI